MDFIIKKGLDLPITGKAPQQIDAMRIPSHVALIGSDYIGMKPTMNVEVGDHVKAGQKVFSCKKNEGLIFTAPASGQITSISRGKRRVFESMVVKIDEQQDFESFSGYNGNDIQAYSSEQIRELLIASGQWTHFRQRPFEKVADVDGTPSSIFVTAIDTQPLAPNPALAIKKYEQEFVKGLSVLKKLVNTPIYVCVDGASEVHTPIDDQIVRARFSGPHPAGNVGTHISMIDPVHAGKYVWHINYQDVIALGYFLETGQLMQEKIISVTGPYATEPSTFVTMRGACISEIVQKQYKEPARMISGSVVNGHQAKESFDYLGAYHHQITIIEEDSTRELLGWHKPGFDRFSAKNIYVSKLFKGKKFDLGSSTHGSPRAIVPIGSYEQVMPLDILPTQLLRALISHETDDAQDLGCLELAEEDLALCTFVSPGKEDFGPILRENLTMIEKEG